jgi:type IV pilus assembly protein PilQ
MPKIVTALIIFFVATLAGHANTLSLNEIKPWPTLNIPLKKTTPYDNHTDPLHATLIPIDHSNIASVSSFIKSNASILLALGAHISVLKNKNCIFVYDTKKKITRIKRWLALINTSAPQVRINARIVTIDSRYVRSLGFDFNSSSTKTTGGLTMDLPKSSIADGTFHINLASVGDHLINLQISALEQQGHARMISSPQVITTNLKPAIIESGEEVPYQQKTASGATSVTFKKAVLKLAVTPEILSGHRILLHIDVHQDKLTAISVNGVPVINTQQIKTNTRILDDHTLVLGGIIKMKIEKTREGIPGLSNIPVLGRLFSHRVYKQSNQRLLIFITPKIITGQQH